MGDALETQATKRDVEAVAPLDSRDADQVLQQHRGQGGKPVVSTIP